MTALVLTLALFAAQPAAPSARPSFPGAAGFGAAARGGIPGRIVHVESLDDAGPGTLREALSTPGPKTIVFDVGGTIELASPLQVPRPAADRTTLAGQTAPGGITVSGNLWLAAYNGGQPVSDIVVRHLRFRGVHTHYAADATGDCLVAYHVDRVIIDHCSFSGGVDECLDLGGSTNVTVGWCTFEESARWGEGGSQHNEASHNRALMIGTYAPQCDWTLHHSLFAHHLNRMPEGAGRSAEMLANVMYNWRPYVGTLRLTGGANVVGNSWICGPDRNPAEGMCLFYEVPEGPLYFADNQFLGPTPETTWAAPQADQQAILDRALLHYQRQPKLVTQPVPMSAWPLALRDCASEYAQVLAQSGSWPRDATTRRTVDEVAQRGGGHGLHGPYERFAFRDNGPTSRRRDRDRDGIEDAWELRHGLDPRTPIDSQQLVPAGASPEDRHQGYRYLEWYLNDLADRLVGYETPLVSVRVTVEGKGRVVCGNSGHTPGWNPARELRGGPVEIDWPREPQLFHRGSSAVLRALPAEGWRFYGWHGGSIQGRSELRIEAVFDEDQQLTAIFSPAELLAPQDAP